VESTLDHWAVAVRWSPLAADATCARFMGLEPIRMRDIQMAGDFLGNLGARAIEVRGDGMPGSSRPSEVLPAFSYLLHRPS
jgi:hypothetical protein